MTTISYPGETAIQEDRLARSFTKASHVVEVKRSRQNATNIRRVRPFLACISCNQGKKKCDKKWPECSKCKSLGRECKWDSRRYGPDGLLPGRRRTRAKGQEPDSPENFGGAGDWDLCAVEESVATIEQDCLSNKNSQDAEKSICIHSATGSMIESGRLCNFSNFLISFSRVAPMNDVLTVQPTPKEELKCLHDLWKMYLGMGKEEIMIWTNTDMERFSFYNSFRAIVCFAHACVYLNYHTAETLSEKMAGVASQMFALTVRSLHAHPEDTITSELIGAFAVMARIRDIATKGDVAIIDTTFALLGDIIDSRDILYSGKDIPDLYILSLLTDLFGRRCGVFDILTKSTILRRKKLQYIKGLEPTNDHWRAMVIFTQFSLNVLTSFVLAQVPNGELSSTFFPKPFSSLPDDVKVMCLDLYDDMKALVALLEAHPKHMDVEKHYGLYLITNAIYPFFHYLELYMGIAMDSKETIIENVERTVSITCHNKSVHDHPLNTGGYCAVTYALAVLASLDRSSLEEVMCDRAMLSSTTADQYMLNKKGRALLAICKDLMLSSTMSLASSGNHLW